MNHKLLLIAFFVFTGFVANAQSTEFTFQGSLKDGANAANGNYDFEFALFDALSAGTQLGSTVTRNGVVVVNGTFTVNLDFGAQFPGGNRFLAISVRQTGGGSFQPLTPRQQISNSPYSVRSLNAGNADLAANATTAATATNALQLGGVVANQYVLTGDVRLSDARNPLPNSTNYIQNQNVGPQGSANFNISGSGTLGGTLSANAVTSGTQFNIGTDRVLWAPLGSFYAGQGSGANNSTGDNNAFFGPFAGNLNTTGGGNSFFGRSAGVSNVGGQLNTFLGGGAGIGNTVGSNNTLIGSQSNVASGNLNYATAIGSFAVVSANNTIVLGRSAGQDTVQIPGNLNVTGIFTGVLPAGSANYIQNTTTPQSSSNFNISGDGVIGGNLGVGTTNPAGKLHINVPGSGNPISALTLDVGTFGTAGNAVNSYYFKVRDLGLGGTPAFLIRGDGNVGIGTSTPTEKLDVNGNIRFSGTISGDGSGLTNVRNRQQIALLKWYDVNQTAVYTIPQAGDIAFDGENMRLGPFKINVHDGTTNGNASSGAAGMVYDGINVWATGFLAANKVAKLRGDTSGLIAQYNVGSQPKGIAFDGANIWVANSVSNNVTKLRASDGACVGTCTYPAGNFPVAVAFDGTNIWVSNFPNNVTKLRASDGLNLGTVSVSNPVAFAFDGSNMWVVDQGVVGQNGNVVKVRASDNAILGTFPVGRTPQGIAYDGSNVWITNFEDNTVTRLRASDGACVGTCTIPVGDRPIGIAFDGTHIWVVNTGSNTLSKL